MRPVFLKLKGFKGIKAGMDLDEIEIDFSGIPDGVVAFSAPNGTGKTTIVDSLHPYRIMPFRTGSYSPKAFSFYEHCYGEAAKELIFAMNGTRYRSLVLIEAAKKKQEAYLFIEANGEWTPLNDGKVESYDTAVEGLLGNPELFFMSVFRAQNAKSLTAYSKGDIKEIFTELLGIDHLKILSERAGGIKIEKQRSLTALRDEKSTLSDAVKKAEDIESELTGIAETRKAARAETESLEAAIAAGQERLSAVTVKIAEKAMKLSQQQEIEADISKKKNTIVALLAEQGKRTRDIEAKISRVKSKIAANETLIAKLPELREAEAKKVVTEQELQMLRHQLTSADTEYTVLSSRQENLRKAEGLMKDKEKHLQKLRLERESALKIASRGLEVARREKEKLKGTPCGGELAEGCVFVTSALSEVKKIPELEHELSLLEGESADEIKTVADISNLQKIVAGNTDLAARIKEALAAKKELQDKTKELEKKIATFGKTLEELPKAILVEEEIPSLQTEISSLEVELNSAREKGDQDISTINGEIQILKDKLAELGNGFDQGFEDEKKTLTAEIEKAKRDIAVLTSKTEEATQRTGALTAELRRVESAKNRLTEIVAKENALADEISQWATLEKALGNDGIIALEISDAGPQITTYANELLKIIGGRFSVKIETQFIKAKGGTKEGFDIVVYDARTNEAKSLKLLSGGEKTWVEEAITRAICLYRANASGITYECLFSDEKDGALDSEKKKEFFDMKQRVLELGGYKNEFCITQTDSLLARADAVIELTKNHGVTVRKN